MNWFILILLVLFTLALIVTLPIMLLYKFLAGSHRSGAVAREEERKMATIIDILDRMESRISSLEHILDEPGHRYSKESRGQEG